MLTNRIAAIAQAATTAVVLTTAIYPTSLGFIRGPVTTALGGAYIAACLAAAAAPADTRIGATVAALAVTWWTVRALSVLMVDPVPWVGVVNPALIAVMVTCYYHRSLARSGFLQRLDEIESQVDSA